jgi:MFS family permease
MIGWSGLEGLGAVLIMPAIVALVASNFGKPERPRAYGLVAAAGAIAAALGPLIGGAFTTYASWRWVFAGEVLIVAVILVLARRVNDTPAEKGVKLDLFGTFLSALGLGLIVFGVLKCGTWGVVQPKPEAPQWIGLSPVIWLLIGGGVALALFLRWENLRIGRGEGALLNPRCCAVRGPGVAGQPARHQRRAGGHHRAAAADRVGPRRDGLAVGQRDRLRGVRTSRAARSGACRTRGPNWARRSVPRWQARSLSPR